ncbi:hypothetical protein HPB49_000170 [Dermacentor silvarum]|uniref:Uncharacterized protein n=1 Tax=Dermacentor silvarum TaxID=543639 RepID=A0ACB8C6K2_DERSI|nr:hypothetical protein HPB49_000170 [Dermacentor silvarum]
MGDKNPSQQWGPGRPHPCASDVSDRFGPSVVDIDTSDGYSTEDMASDSDFTVVSSHRLKRKIRRTSPTTRQPPKKASGMRSYTISYVPTTTTDILNSLNRQSLTEYFELVAPGQVEEIRINAQKNILSVEVNTKTILDTLKAIGQLGNISVRAFSAYDKETTTGVIYDVDEDITDSSLEKLLSSSAPIASSTGVYPRQDYAPPNPPQCTLLASHVPITISDGQAYGLSLHHRHAPSQDDDHITWTDYVWAATRATSTWYRPYIKISADVLLFSGSGSGMVNCWLKLPSFIFQAFSDHFKSLFTLGDGTTPSFNATAILAPSPTIETHTDEMVVGSHKIGYHKEDCTHTDEINAAGGWERNSVLRFDASVWWTEHSPAMQAVRRRF